MPWTPLENPADVAGKHETSTFDWKQTYDFADPTTPFEVAKDVAALASALGGTILVGAIEGKGDRRGSVAAFKSISDPGTLVKKISDSVTQRSRPLPVFEPRLLTLGPDEQRAALGREPTEDEVTVLAINVWPLASGPVGVKSCDDKGTAIPDAWRFPVRGGEGTRLLLPEELALYLSAHERKIGLLLRRIPTTRLRVYDDHRATNLIRQIESIDDERMLVVLSMEGYRGDVVKAHIPFTFIRTVWQDEHGEWNIFVEGDAFTDPGEPSRPQFMPTRK